jgi:cell wall-associated NlpC family hydrolase
LSARGIIAALGGVILLQIAACADPPRGIAPLPEDEPSPRFRQSGTPAISDLDGVVEWARGRIGAPYQWGGTGSYGYDCSGLVQSAFAHGGVRLPRTAQAQASRGRAVSSDQLQPGDLVFFGDGESSIDHVGIVTHGTLFVHASSSRGVVEDSLTDRYFRRRYVFARRLSRSTASR